MNVNNSDVVISTIIATVGRSTLGRAVESVLAQVLPVNFEVIVVNDSRNPLPVEVWQQSKRVKILNTNQRERCVARNAGAAIALGKYLHFLDDDDWMLPNAFKELWAIAGGNNASLVYGTTNVVNRDGTIRAQQHIGVEGNAFVQLTAGELIPLCSILFENKVFFEVGGFDSRYVGSEDWDIGRRVALLSDVAGTRFPVACLVRDSEHTTTNYTQARYYNQVSTEHILHEKGSFARMLASAKDSYWRGKMIHTYFFCVKWNLKKGRLLKMLKCASTAIASMLLSPAHIFSRAFWKSFFRYHHSHVNT